MRLKNTSTIDTQTIRDIIRFVKPAKVANFDIWIKKSQKAFYGRAYTDGCDYHSDLFVPYVVIRIGNPTFPLKIGGFRAYIEHYVNNITELLITLIAHELYHLKQSRLHKRFSEKEADKYAIKKLEQYRKEKEGKMEIGQVSNSVDPSVKREVNSANKRY